MHGPLRLLWCQRLLIRPRPAPGLDWVKAEYRSIHGPIGAEWKIEGDRLAVTVRVPANATAEVRLPAADPATVIESGRCERRAKKPAPGRLKKLARISHHPY